MAAEPEPGPSQPVPDPSLFTEPSASVAELAQADLIGWLVERKFLTAEGLAAVRSRLAHDPQFGSAASRAVLALAVRALARAGGWEPTDDPHWPGPDDPMWGMVPVPDPPDDASSLGEHGPRW